MHEHAAPPRARASPLAIFSAIFSEIYGAAGAQNDLATTRSWKLTFIACRLYLSRAQQVVQTGSPLHPFTVHKRDRGSIR
jgi:hypothetical protein